MRSFVLVKFWRSCLFIASAGLVVSLVGGPHALARGPGLTAFETLYGGVSDSSDVAQCAVCHATNPGDASWNQYGWDINAVLGTPGCDSWQAAIQCVENDPSVSDVPGTYTYLEEIQASAQPGWTAGNANAVYTNSGDLFDRPPVADLGPYDPLGGGGAGGAGGGGGMGGAGGDCPTTGTIPPEQISDGTILVMPGQSIQEAIDLAPENTRIEIQPGIYEEPCNTTNGLNVTKSGIHLIGLGTSAAGPDSVDEERVIVRSTGDPQRNGIVIVPLEVPAEAQPLFGLKVERTDCMGCHSDMAPPFPLLPGVPHVILKQNDPWLTDIRVEGITIQGFSNNGLFTEHVDDFVFDDVESVDNRNYGIFPVLSANGVIRNSYSTGSDLDSALWVETSVDVEVRGNLVENSVNGIEVSNSDGVLVVDNEARNNTVGAAILLLPDIYDNRDSAKRIDMENNWLYDNNKPNTARPGSILAEIPSGIGIIYLGVDDSVASGNLVENNDFAGIAVVDYCLPLLGTDFGCTVDPTITPDFLLDETAENNRVEGNTLVNNATNPAGQFAQFAGDLVLLTGEARGNCFADNDFDTEFSFTGELPPCPEDPETGGAGGMGGEGGAGGEAGSGGSDSGGGGGGGCAVDGDGDNGPAAAWLVLLLFGWALSRSRSRMKTST